MENSEPILKLAVIGGGASAAAVLDAILEHVACHVNISITVYDPSPHLWCGYAFQPDGEGVLSNVSMGIMSVRANDNEHGIRWLAGHGFDAYTPEITFPPRSVVGQYLKSSANRTINELVAAGSSVTVEKLSVRGLDQRHDGLWVEGGYGTHGPFDHAILCPGTSKSYDPYLLSGHPGYIAAPYPLSSSLKDVPTEARVAIIGSGLTAVDTVMALRERGHKGPISMVSRNGSLPSVRSAPVRYTPACLTLDNIASLVRQNGAVRISDVVALAEKELKLAGANILPIAAALTEHMTPEQQLRKDLESAMDPDPGWTILRNGMIGIGQHAWYFLTDEDKAYLRTVNRKLMRFLCPMPALTAQRLLAMLETKQLEIVSSITKVEPIAKGAGRFEIRASHNITADVVIGASTPATREAGEDVQKLMDSLIAQGLAVANPFGGLDVDITSSRVTSPLGVANPRIHALGDLTSGAYFFIFGLSILVSRADYIARDIASAVKAARYQTAQSAVT